MSSSSCNPWSPCLTSLACVCSVCRKCFDFADHPFIYSSLVQWSKSRGNTTLGPCPLSPLDTAQSKERSGPRSTSRGNTSVLLSLFSFTCYTPAAGCISIASPSPPRVLYLVRRELRSLLSHPPGVEAKRPHPSLRYGPFGYVPASLGLSAILATRAPQHCRGLAIHEVTLICVLVCLLRYYETK